MNAAGTGETTGSDEHLPDIEWLSVPEAAAWLGVRDRDVRSMISERSLLGVRRNGSAPAIPAQTLMTDAESGSMVVVPGVRGTLIQLSDGGFSDHEIVAWLFRHNDELDATPIAALAALRTHAVRRAAQALVF